MQRKRNTKGKCRYSNISPTTIMHRLLSLCNLHSIPKLLNTTTINSNASNNTNNSISKLSMKSNKVKSNVLYSIPNTVSLVLFFGLCGFCSLLLHSALYNNSCYATTSASLSLSNDNMVSEPVTPGDIAIAETNVSVVVNDAESYTLRLSVDSTTITNGGNSSDSNNVLTAGNPNDSNSTNVWGYKWDNASTYTAPTSSGTILTSSTNPSSNDTKLNSTNGSTSFTKTLTFGAKFSSNANAGTYHGSGTLSLVATPRATVRTLTYNLNGGNISGSTTNPTQTCSDYGTGCNITMSYTDPTRSGHDFLGWADGSTATSADTTNYGNGKVVTISASTTSKIIYAVWKAQGASWSNGVNSGITYMQDIDKATNSGGFCSSSIPNWTTITLKDNRDYPTATVTSKDGKSSTLQQISNEYVITKMSDGKCWMTQNLRLTGSDTATTLITGGASGNSNTPGNYSIPKNDKSAFPSSGNTAQAAFLGTDNAGNVTGYYTWCTATAGTCPSNGNASASICPKNWILPTSGDFSTFASAEDIPDSAAGFAKIQEPPYNFAITGAVSNGSYGAPTNNSLGNSYWWSSSTYYSTTRASDLEIDATEVRILRMDIIDVYPGTAAGSRYKGYAVRCIAQ